MADTRRPRSKAAIVWSDWFWLWQLYLVGGSAAAIAIVFIPAGPPRGNPFGGAAALSGLAVWALTFGRALRSGHRTWSFVAGVVALWTIALTCTPAALAGLPVVYPLVFTSLPLRSAIAVTSIVNLLPVAVLGAQGTLDPVGLPMAAALALLACLLSPAIGVWITKTAEQSEERAVLLAALSASRAEAARLSHQAGIAAERARLAREIHDTLAQGFTSIVALAHTVESELQDDPVAARRHVALIRTIATDNLAEARTMVAALTPSALSAGSLVDSIQRLGTRLTAETGIEVTVIAPDPPLALSTGEEVILLRAAQEALRDTLQPGPQPDRAALMPLRQSGQPLDERLHWTGSHHAHEPAHLQVDQDRAPATGQIVQPPLIAAVHPPRWCPAAVTLRVLRTGMRDDPDAGTEVFDLVKLQIVQLGEEQEQDAGFPADEPMQHNEPLRPFFMIRSEEIQIVTERPFPCAPCYEIATMPRDQWRPNTAGSELYAP